MQEFRDKVAVGTGAASGIGRALAERFCAEGMKVVLADIEAGALARAEEELRAQGAIVLAVRTDVRQASEVDALAENALATFGGTSSVTTQASPFSSLAGNTPWQTGNGFWERISGVSSTACARSSRSCCVRGPRGTS